MPYELYNPPSNARVLGQAAGAVLNLPRAAIKAGANAAYENVLAPTGRAIADFGGGLVNPAGDRSSTQNAVSTATENLPAANSPNNPALNQPRYPTELAQSQMNMRDGDIKVVSQDSTYPGAGQPGPSAIGRLPAAQAPNFQFANMDNIGNSVSLGGTGGGGTPGGDYGMFSPGMASQLDDLYKRSTALLGSRSMVDNWRGRQAAKMRDRMMLSEAAMGNTRVGAANARANMLSSQASALRAANEVPLAQMGDYTTRRGQDVHRGIAELQSDTNRYATDVGATSQQYSVDAQQRINYGKILEGQQQGRALAEGDLDAVKDISEAFSPAQQKESKAGKWEYDPTGGGAFTPGGGGLPKFYTREEIKDESNRARREAKAREK